MPANASTGRSSFAANQTNSFFLLLAKAVDPPNAQGKIAKLTGCGFALLSSDTVTLRFNAVTEGDIMGFINISYNTLLANHPSMTDDFKTMINGSIKKFHDEPGHKNTCGSKMCWAFNHVDGHYINCDGDYGKGGVLVKKVRFLMDDDGWEYIYSTLDLRQYLNNRYGSGQMFPNTSKIGDRNGVIIFEPTDTSNTGHTDIWVNGQIHDADLYYGSWYSAVTNDRVFFWDLNS